MITRGRKRTEEESNLSQKRLRERAKRAKDIGKRARGAKSREPAHQGDATGAIVVTQSGKERYHDNQEKPTRGTKRSTKEDIEVSTKKAKNGQEEWEEKNEGVT